MESPCIILQVQIGTGKGDQQQNSATRPGIFATWKPGEAAFDNRMAIQIQRLAGESTDVGLSISQPSWGGYSTQVLIFKTIDTSLLLTSRGKVGVERRETIFRVPRRQMAAFWANSSDNKMQQGYDYDAVVIGAGPNGLAAAIRIAQHGFSTLLLGGSSKVGEASYTGFCIDATPNPLPRRDTFALAAMASTGVFFKTLLSKAFQ